MKNLHDTCIEFLKNENIKKYLQDMTTPIFDFIYNKMYFYIWFICIYNVFLIFIVLANLFLLLRLLQKNEYSFSIK